MTIQDDYSRCVLEDLPVGYWRLNELSHAASVQDEVCEQRVGAFVGQPKLGEPPAITRTANASITFSDESHIAIPSSPAFSIQTSGQGLSVEAWVRPDKLTFAGEYGKQYIHWLGKGVSGKMEWGFRLYSSDHLECPKRISAYAWNPNGKLGAGDFYQDQPHSEDPLIQIGRWVHLVACYEDYVGPGQPLTGVSLYINGRLAQCSESRTTRYSYPGHWSVVPHAGDAPLRIGTRSAISQSFLTGGIDEVAIYPTVLPASRIARHYEIGCR